MRTDFQNQSDAASAGRIFKTLRADKNDFWDVFAAELVSPSIKKPELRHGERKKYTVKLVNGEYVVRPTSKAKKQKLPGESYNEADKKLYSRHQSTSYSNYQAGYAPPYFGWDRDRAGLVVGVSFDPQDCLIKRIMIYDGGTLDRPYDFDDENAAQVFIKQKLKSRAWHKNLASLAEFGKSTASSKNNEVMTKFRWTSRSSITVFSDNLQSRLLAQIRAADLKNRLKDKSPDQDVVVPITMYPDFSLYTEESQHADRKSALSIAKEYYLVLSFISDGVKPFDAVSDWEGCFIRVYALIKKVNQVQAKQFLLLVKESIMQKGFFPFFAGGEEGMPSDQEASFLSDFIALIAHDKNAIKVLWKREVGDDCLHKEALVAKLLMELDSRYFLDFMSSLTTESEIMGFARLLLGVYLPHKTPLLVDLITKYSAQFTLILNWAYQYDKVKNILLTALVTPFGRMSYDSILPVMASSRPDTLKKIIHLADLHLDFRAGLATALFKLNAGGYGISSAPLPLILVKTPNVFRALVQLAEKHVDFRDSFITYIDYNIKNGSDFISDVKIQCLDILPFVIKLLFKGVTLQAKLDLLVEGKVFDALYPAVYEKWKAVRKHYSHGFFAFDKSNAEVIYQEIQAVFAMREHASLEKGLGVLLKMYGYVSASENSSDQFALALNDMFSLSEIQPDEIVTVSDRVKNRPAPLVFKF